MQWTEWLAGFAGASPIEWIATVSGFLCVFLIIKRSIWCFFFGLIQVSLYSYIFYDVKLYSDMILHLIYVGFQIYGYWIWSKNLDDGGHVIVDHGSQRYYLQIATLAIIATLLWGWVMANNTDASLPYFDAFTTCVSLVAQWLMSHKKLYNWSFWIVVDVVAIWVYWQKDLYPTSVLYLCFLVMACIGQYQWWRIYHKNTSQVA
ncbi:MULTISPECIES: nicotinamide riboside transporter PnuC [Alteromonadaceae]|uniref:nicotinamide riboside transporter PnuC n=1 Tax=Alteromonadaceae TaxID=72275 RepID=UPI001C087B1A|nr:MULTISPECIES: nicotinamide riboside transporter PnuC [Aliiglaciecola]MBU2876612.1 nicotinamide riboside transporter PnuC [Aliiglaciecola lipolytica]MDO6711453.1 nicotinamide riboside transporter PnuC [Aliiglaciecola sp. 2_MG-2023]MDO6752570.1 nicotinamide riboside transporter PnuC [Aliiglaciecola sp. 1_MG-2023]